MTRVQSQDVLCRGFYRLAQVQEKFPVSRSTIYRMMKEDRFPKSVRLSRQLLGWWKDEVDDYCERLRKAAA
jgi:predicted DNA-binding transcriptional regulator AlpA